MLIHRHGIVCFKRMVSVLRAYSTELNTNDMPKKTIDVLKKRYDTDEWTNISPKILSIVNTNLHLQKHHPLDLVRQRIVNYFYKNYKGRSETPIFSVFDNLSPVVTTSQNFDSLLIPKDHPSRSKRDCFYINRDHLLRAHTTAHQVELISMGLDNFLIVGEVYRRDEIDAKHYPVFHQMDGVRTFTSEQLFNSVKTNNGSLQLFEENRVDSDEKQGCHTLEAVKIVEHQLKTALLGVAEDLFGKDLKYRWVDQFFPFTHPSWELEIFYNDDWFEVCGCGIIKQQILSNAGTSDRIGWAFGLGLERLAMCLYNIPDIRLFWSSDTGFLNQFKVDDIYTPIKFKPVSVYPKVANDMSFWLPSDGSYCSNDFYDIVRELAGDTVEQIEMIDEFLHPKVNKLSHTYRITYRHMERVITQRECTQIHNRIKAKATSLLKVEPR